MKRATFLSILLLIPIIMCADDKKSVSASCGASARIISQDEQASIGMKNDTIYHWNGTLSDTITKSKRIYVVHYQ